MHYRSLGKTGIRISALSFGAGPISTLMVGDDRVRQCQVIARALEAGMNWFDTAATYGQGQSERNLGHALKQLNASESVYVATKVRLTSEDLDDIRGTVRRSLRASLERLQLPSVTLLQLHNSITRRRGDEPTSVTPEDVLQPGGVADAFAELRAEGLVRHVGLTGIGHPLALRKVVQSGRFETMQVPYHLLNPSAGQVMTNGFAETNYGNIIADCAREEMGVLAIRVFAGGAILNNPPSPHTFKTPFFPLKLYEHDRERATRLQRRLGPEYRLQREATRFVLAHPNVSSALIGFAETWQIDEALEALHDDSPSPVWENYLAVG
jgi:aryl-alcohol dehydrogenase-like predicted oxidoreductase